MHPWILAIRPKTLPAAIAPVMIATAMAFGDGHGHGPAAGMALLAALCLQIGTNLANDYFDFKKGADTPDRQGPIRVTQAGLIKPDLVLKMAMLFFVGAFLSSLYLMHRGGAVIFLIAVLSIVSGIFYTAGSKPLAYLGLGDIFVFVFFGPVAVGGTYFTQTLHLPWYVIFAGFGPGFLAMAILAVNNLRDRDTDARAGKRTLAVRFGRCFAMNEYLTCVIAACVTPLIIILITRQHSGIALSGLMVFFAIGCIKIVFTSKDGFLLNSVLATTGKLLLMYSILFAIGWLWCPR